MFDLHFIIAEALHTISENAVQVASLSKPLRGGVTLPSGCWHQVRLPWKSIDKKFSQTHPLIN